MSEKKMVRLGVNLPEELRERFKKVAILNDTDMGSLVRQWIEDYVSKYENPRPQKKRIRRKKAGVNSAEVKEADSEE